MSVAELTGLPGQPNVALGFLRDVLPAVVTARLAMATHVLTLD